MDTRTQRKRFYLVACLSVLALVLTGCREEAPVDPNAASATPVSNTEQASVDPLEVATGLFREPPADVQNIVDAAKTWDVAFKQHWGKIAPDFTLSDIEGNVHTLSDYRGKNVVVVIWATWVSTCKLQVPHLKELRTAFEDKDLAILTISNEPPGVLKEFAEKEGINFTVLSGGANLPAPFGQVEYAPGSFFIGPRGRFKLASTGLVPAEDAKAIVQAK